MKTKLEKDVRFLKAYAAVITLVGAAFGLSAFESQPQKQKFGEIDVERLNVVERDGKVKMVISNAARLPDGVIAGKVVARDQRTPGILFYNDEGDEAGGLVFSGGKKEGKVNASASLTFDQYQQDQTLQLVYSDEGDYRLVGMRVKDRPDMPGPEQARRLEEVEKMKEGAEREAAMKPLRAPDRVFVGKSGKNAAVWLFDADGKPRIKMSVDGSGNPKIEFLDGSGKVIQTLPDLGSTTKK